MVVDDEKFETIDVDHTVRNYETVGVIGAHVRADKTRKLLITERRRRITRVCHGRATSNTLHSDRTGTEAAATMASSTTDNRVVGRAGGGKHARKTRAQTCARTLERGRRAAGKCVSWLSGGGHGRCEGWEGRLAWRATDSVLPTAHRQNTGRLVDDEADGRTDHI